MIKEIRKVALGGAMGAVILAMGNVCAVESLKVYDGGDIPLNSEISFDSCNPVVKGAILKQEEDTCLNLGCHGMYEIVSGGISIDLQGGAIPYLVTQRDNAIYFNNPGIMGTLNSNGFNCYVTINLEKIFNAESELGNDQKVIKDRFALGIRREGDDDNYLAILHLGEGKYPSSATFHVTREDTLKFIPLFSKKEISNELVPVTSETSLDDIDIDYSSTLNLSSIFRVVANVLIEAPELGSWAMKTYGNADAKIFDSHFANGLYARVDNGSVVVAKDFSGTWTKLSKIEVSNSANLGIAFIDGQYLIYSDDKGYALNSENWNNSDDWGGEVTVSDRHNLCTSLDTMLFSVNANGDTSYSLNGINWFDATKVGQTVDFFTSGNGVMIALDTNGNLSISEKGNRWNKSISLIGLLDGESVAGVAFGNGRFLAVTENGKIASSVNGSTWEKFGEVGTDNCKNLVFRDGKFFVLASDKVSGERVYTAPDFPIEVK